MDTSNSGLAPGRTMYLIYLHLKIVVAVRSLPLVIKPELTEQQMRWVRQMKSVAHPSRLFLTLQGRLIVFVDRVYCMLRIFHAGQLVQRDLFNKFDCCLLAIRSMFRKIATVLYENKFGFSRDISKGGKYYTKRVHTVRAKSSVSSLSAIPDSEDGPENGNADTKKLVKEAPSKRDLKSFILHRSSVADV